MIFELKKIAIIPARGGSKRIFKKNIKNFCGKPIIGWVIEKLRDSHLFSEIIVSTDDYEIAEVSKKFGAKVPFIRTKSLSDDYTTTAPVISNAIHECEKIGYSFNYVCCVYPCSPFITIDDLKIHLKKWLVKNLIIYPITEYKHPIQRSLRISASKMEFFS